VVLKSLFLRGERLLPRIDAPLAATQDQQTEGRDRPLRVAWEITDEGCLKLDLRHAPHARTPGALNYPALTGGEFLYRLSPPINGQDYAGNTIPIPLSCAADHE
jgi:hypothetical protein